jgi:hypothetical protein
VWIVDGDFTHAARVAGLSTARESGPTSGT